MPIPHPHQPSQSKTLKTQYTHHSFQQPPSHKSSYDQQFHSIYQQITQHQYFTRITKHDKIRINKWLTKLSNISTNDLWKKNRNNYIKLIRLMFDCQVIIAPFLMMPPERDLHKLTTHEINVIIDQVDKIVEEREAKNCLIPSNGIDNTGGSGSGNNSSKFNRVAWMQESAYVNHHNQHNNTNSSLQKFKDCYQNDSRKTYQTSSVTMNNNMSKISQLQSPLNQIPPKYPSSKSPINSKFTTNLTSKSPINCKNPQSQKQSYTIKQSQQQIKHKSRQRSLQPQSLSPQNYFRKKQRLNTFQTEDQPQEYQMQMNNLERNSPIVYEKEHYDIGQNHGENFIQHQSREAIDILKCGFRLLQKLPLQSIQSSSLKEIQTFRKIINQNDFLKHDLQKESRLLELLSERGTNRTALNEVNSMNNTQKLNLKKKMKLTVISQAHRNQALKTTN